MYNIRASHWLRLCLAASGLAWTLCVCFLAWKCLLVDARIYHLNPALLSSGVGSPSIQEATAAQAMATVPRKRLLRLLESPILFAGTKSNIAKS
ncbi:hypothetical protein QBC33DRAFT_539315 [Phialemonium atrogriseum]|uniref:Uncharacterized protein n=1 Tax=Phialemonium atrogriseum TaxID=1093897 RepID=A0AAJ0BZ21_9PEZI|nr:uncharacterized protein QBC33DRAFT_539315 [Phialemonium atrogriseum]KAK1767138.1 hypothetical protein QBC33DRAFT_539315 [Phialemonium atrogriseum]